MVCQLFSAQIIINHLHRIAIDPRKGTHPPPRGALRGAFDLFRSDSASIGEKKETKRERIPAGSRSIGRSGVPGVRRGESPIADDRTNHPSNDLLCKYVRGEVTGPDRTRELP